MTIHLMLQDMITAVEKSHCGNEEHRYKHPRRISAAGESLKANLFSTLLASPLPLSEKLPKRLAHEGFEILLAGTDTTARTMGLAVYHILANPDVLYALKVELKNAIPKPDDRVDLGVLESLPWLVSVVTPRPCYR